MTSSYYALTQLIFVLSDGTTQTVTGASFDSVSDIMHTYTTPNGQRFIGFNARASGSDPLKVKISALKVLYGPCAITLSLSSITTLS